VILYLFFKTNSRHKQGLITGVALFTFALARFLMEFFKENQVGFEDTLTINMGQILSIPFIIIGLVLIIVKIKSKTAEINTP
jgi:phosphatidylglycerol---prolipoprotein diacylglyceryl transferase